MASRQTQLHSYQFAVQRTVSALVTRDPDPGQAPFRRVGGAGFASLMIAIVALAAVGVYGLVVAGGNRSWRNDGTVVIERESGAKFVYLEGRLHPVLNYASALLIAGNADPRTVSVSRKSLAGATRGTPLGIVGAPDSLVARNRLLRGAWTVCTGPVRRPNGALAPDSVLLVGAGPARSRPLARIEAIFVRHPDGTEYMVWNGRKFRVPADDQRVVHDAVVVASNRIAPAAPAWLNVLPSGADLTRVTVPKGAASAVAGYTTGDVVVVDTPGVGRSAYAVLADGLAPLTPLQANLLTADAARVTEQSPGWFATQPRSATSLAPPEHMPETSPEVVPAPREGESACAAFADGAGVPAVGVEAVVPAAGAAMTGARSPTGAILADRVLVEPGRGAVVAAVPSAAAAGTIVVVTDVGVAHPVPGPDVLGMLGYRGMAPNPVPSSVVALLPPGQALEPDAARAPAAGT